MKKYILILLIFASRTTWADNFGFNLATGFPYLSTFGINYLHSSKMISADLSYNSLSFTSSLVTVSMTKPELSVKWHPFSGSFYLGVGLGQQTLSSKASDSISGQPIEVSIAVNSTTATAQVGWMWGIDDAGFFGGIDFGYQSPSGAKSTTTTTASAAIQATAEYQTLITDTNDQARKFGEIPFVIITGLRLGYLF